MLDPDDSEYYLVEATIEVEVDEPCDFREDLVYYGLNQYEYKENKAYKTVEIGGVDLLKYDDNEDPYHTISVNSESSDFETEWFSYIEPYYVKTKDCKSYICVYNLTKEEEGIDSTLNVYALENGEVKLLGVSETGLNYKGGNMFALPTNPDSIIQAVKE